MISENEKQNIKRGLAGCLKTEKEIRRIVIFGSFLSSTEPNDMDVAIFQDSDEKYLPLAMKYRKKTRDITRIIPLDIIPIKNDAASGFFLDEISQGEVIYERDSKVGLAPPI
jgi:predicted nucleotidyltransferase